MILRSNKNNKSKVCQCLNRPKIGQKMKEMNNLIQKIFQILMRVKSNLSELGVLL
ncbi:hypothetical protein RDI58_017698 [Solanum bulbocastanum]|uniref:Uncharacterized protein n=1 Tax=Solanum bulbocastanum TaxID=147425 RepID=A0AAN8TAB3_SOLBU